MVRELYFFTGTDEDIKNIESIAKKFHASFVQKRNKKIKVVFNSGYWVNFQQEIRKIEKSCIFSHINQNEYLG
jgi:hypothetical protein